jgi:type VI secretion system ImpB/VipA family protein
MLSFPFFGGGVQMEYQVNFGTIGSKHPAAKRGAKFRLAVLGDFSGRANAGKLETGGALAERKPIKVDVDNLDDLIARMKLSLSLPLGDDGRAVTVPIGSMDDFHPDQIAENVELFGSLLDLRKNLSSRAGFDRAAREVLSWGGEEPLPPPPRRSGAATVATDRRLSDFARLIGQPAAAPSAAERSVDEWMRRLVGPYIEPKRDARQDALIARVDEALSATMRRILRHPDFQTAESLWRGIELLVRHIETDARTEIVLYDVSAEELAADLATNDSLESSGLYGMLVEKPVLDAHQGAISAIIGLYGFELTPPHADLLGRAAQIAAAAGAPFIAAISPDPLKAKFQDQHPLIQDAWSALYALPAAAYLGLATPRFLLRMPYGRKTDPIDAFGFEEFTRQSGLSGMLWAHPGLLAGYLLAATWVQQGAKMKLGSVMNLGEMPYYVYTDEDGEQIALPCTERLYSERQAVQVASYHVMPVLSLRGRPEVRLGGFTSLAGKPLAGFWAPAEAAPPAEPTPAETPAMPAAEESEAAPAEAGAAPEEEVAATPEAAAAEPAAASADAATDELDSLLASLNAEPPPAAPDSTESDLDALLASLK